jgi:hypothetical protein
MKPTWCTFHSIYWESRACTCFEHYLLILRRRYTMALGILRPCYVSWLCHEFRAIVAQPTDITRMQYMYTKCRLCSTSWGWASNARNMYRLLILNKMNEKCFTLCSLYLYTRCTVSKTLSANYFKSLPSIDYITHANCNISTFCLRNHIRCNCFVLKSGQALEGFIYMSTDTLATHFMEAIQVNSLCNHKRFIRPLCRNLPLRLRTIFF